MHISNCENPLTIYNRYLRKTLEVSCGKCISCRNARSQSWVNRLQAESKCWRYSFELYLDYNDEMIPSFDFSKDGNFLYERQKRFYTKSVDINSLRFPLSSLDFHDDIENFYVIQRLNTVSSALPHPSVRDIQLFKKRLNKYIFEKYGKYKLFRSAIVAEIGPTTFRPHYHGILFFSEPGLSQDLNRFVRKAWQDGTGVSLGHAYARPDRGGTCSYVAKYICRPTDLPAIYSLPAFSPFFLTSRNPPIGSLLQSNEEIRKIFFTASPQTLDFKVSEGKGRPCFVPLSPVLENRLFPKCPLFSSLSPTLRTELYKSVITSRGLPTFDEYIENICLRIGSDYNFQNYSSSDSGFPAHIGQCRPSQFAELIGAATHNFESYEPLRPFYRLCARIWYQSQIFGVSYDFYINQIYKYYDNKELLKLRSFYRFQEDYDGDSSDLDCMYQFRTVKGTFRKTREYRCFEFDQHYIYENSRKTIKKNTYFDSLKQKNEPLYKLVKSYYYGKKCHESLEALA